MAEEEMKALTEEELKKVTGGIGIGFESDSTQPSIVAQRIHRPYKPGLEGLNSTDLDSVLKM